MWQQLRVIEKNLLARKNAWQPSINNPRIIDLFSYKVYGGSHKGGYGIVN